MINLFFVSMASVLGGERPPLGEDDDTEGGGGVLDDTEGGGGDALVNQAWFSPPLPDGAVGCKGYSDACGGWLAAVTVHNEVHPWRWWEPMPEYRSSCALKVVSRAPVLHLGSVHVRLASRACAPSDCKICARRRS